MNLVMSKIMYFREIYITNFVIFLKIGLKYKKQGNLNCHWFINYSDKYSWMLRKKTYDFTIEKSEI